MKHLLVIATLVFTLLTQQFFFLKSGDRERRLLKTCEDYKLVSDGWKMISKEWQQAFYDLENVATNNLQTIRVLTGQTIQ